MIVSCIQKPLIDSPAVMRNLIELAKKKTPVSDRCDAPESNEFPHSDIAIRVLLRVRSVFHRQEEEGRTDVPASHRHAGILHAAALQSKHSL